MSSTFSPAETLRQHRPLLLAMEAIGWFHMAGKARREFLRYHGGDKITYEYGKWHHKETPPFPWDDLLEWVKRLYGTSIPSSAWPGSFGEFTENHTGRDAGFLGLLQAGHGIVSGIEKNLPTSTSEYLNQTLLHMWLSSPWGHPKRNLLANSPDILSPQGWRQLVAEMRRVLEELRDLGTRGEQDATRWERWRRRAIGPESYIQRAFLSTLAETRLPNNDVTLWDQSYVAAALFKSTVAGALLQGSSFPWSSNGIKSQVRWRLLTVAIGAEHYEARSVKIGDWTGAQGMLEGFFRRVEELIEVDLAMGSLLYRDGTVAVFSFPGERFDETVPANWLDGWEKWLQDEVDKIAQALDLETPPVVCVSRPTRSLVPMVQERQEAQRTVAVPVHRPWDISRTEDQGHVCPVCRVRLNGDPTSKTRPCRVCRDRRHHRRDDWLQGKLGYDTIWFEEVADRNGRLALLTFALDLEPWLDAERVDSLRVQAIPEWARFNPVLFNYWQRDESKRRYEPNPVRSDDLMGALALEIQKRFYHGSHLKFRDERGKEDLLFTNLQEGYRHNRRFNPKRSGESGQDYEERLWRIFFHQIVEDRADAPEWNNLNDDERAAWLVHQLFRKLPSPGRVYRFWRGAEEFFNDLLREFRQITARSANPWRVRRLVLIPESSTTSGWKDRTLYDGRWQGMQCSLVYLQTLGGFITACNLSQLLQPEEQRAVLQGERVDLEEEDTFRKRKSLVVGQVKEVQVPHSHLGVYSPIIPLDLSPLRFRVVVPLETASECVDLAITRWQEQSARVWERLPLRIGVVAFTRTLPFQAVIEATRNLEEPLADKCEEAWRVERHAERHGVAALQLRRRDRRTTLRTLPITMPDGRPDVFYPYVKVEDRDLHCPRDFRHPKGQIYRHVADLKAGDGIRVAPARINTLFMDSTAARFDMPDPRYMEDWEEMREVWKLLESVAPSQTALQRLRSELHRLQREWQSLPETTPEPTLWWESLRALITTHLDVEDPTLEMLTEFAVNGLLTWAIEWHMTTLKQSI